MCCWEWKRIQFASRQEAMCELADYEPTRRLLPKYAQSPSSDQS